MNICFITDGGLALGMGHVQQSLTLARAFGGRASVGFLTRSGEQVVSLIRAAGFSAQSLATDAEVLEHVIRENPDTVIFDKIDVPEDLAREIRQQSSAALVIFTNLTGANRYADIAVTADIGSEFRNVRYVDAETGTLTYFGPRYWVLREEFHEYRRRGKQRRATIERVLLMFGGSDPADLTSSVLAELLKRDEPLFIDVILGAYFGHDAAVGSVLSAHENRRDHVTVHRRTPRVAELMFAADLAIVSPGLSVFEALCVGTPVIVMPQDELQRDTYHGFMRVVERHEVGRLHDMIARTDFTFPEEEHIALMQPGEGVAELIDEILSAGARRAT